jgi:hypothetical protein
LWFVDALDSTVFEIRHDSTNTSNRNAFHRGRAA